MQQKSSKNAAPAKKAAKKAAPKKERYFIAVAAVEIVVDEQTKAGLQQRIEEIAADLQLPLDEVGESGLIKVFKGEEIPLKVKPPELSI